MDSTVSVVTNDGRTMLGTLKGLDQKLNVILEECKERVFSKDEGMEEVRHYVWSHSLHKLMVRSGPLAFDLGAR